MSFVRAFGSEGTAPGQFGKSFGIGPGDTPGRFYGPCGATVVRGLLVVSEEKRLQVLTPKGVPLQVLKLQASSFLYGLCADEERVWVADRGAHRVYTIKFRMPTT